MSGMIFEGVQYEPGRDGKFRCPWRCGSDDYPQPSWKTEKGFTKHLGGCAAKAQAEWKPTPEPERKVFTECPDCGANIMYMSSCWQMRDRMVCIDCWEPYYEAGIGYHSAAGLDLPGISLEG